MIPGEMKIEQGEITLNEGRQILTILVANAGDRPIQVGSHYHFFEVNPCLTFERDDTRGFRLNIPAGTAVRFEPGQIREVDLIVFQGMRKIFGFNAKIQGPLEDL